MSTTIDQIHKIIKNSRPTEKKKKFVEQFICAECKKEIANIKHTYYGIPCCSEECYDRHICQNHNLSDHWILEFICQCCSKHIDDEKDDYQERNKRGSCFECNEDRYCRFCLQKHDCKQDALVKDIDGSTIPFKELYRRDAIKKKHSELCLERDKSKKELLELPQKIEQLDIEIKKMEENNQDIFF